jgi:hypothetical protein
MRRICVSFLLAIVGWLGVSNATAKSAGPVGSLRGLNQVRILVEARDEQIAICGIDRSRLQTISNEQFKQSGLSTADNATTVFRISVSAMQMAEKKLCVMTFAGSLFEMTSHQPSFSRSIGKNYLVLFQNNMIAANEIAEAQGAAEDAIEKVTRELIDKWRSDNQPKIPDTFPNTQGPRKV